MAVLTVVNFCLLALFVALFGSALVKVVFAADMAMADGLTKLKKTAFEPLRSALAPAIILIATSARNPILKIVSIFKIYLRFAVKGAVILIILGTIIPFLEPVFLFAIRGNSISSKNSGENDAVFDLLQKSDMFAREEILDSKGRKYDDNGLRALGGYCEEVIEVEGKFDEAEILSQFEKKHPQFKAKDLELTILK